MAAENGAFLRELTEALVATSSTPQIETAKFARACEKVLPFFDHLGAVFAFAKTEFEGKKDSLLKIAGGMPTLASVVDADKKAKTVTTKNSCARNLHRLMSAILFIKLLLAKLLHGPAETTLREAASYAYEEALAPIHTMVVKGAVRAGLLALPTRSAFLETIGESEATAGSHAEEFVAAADKVVESILGLYDEPMPPSNSWFIST